MRTMRRVGVALLTALAFSTPVFAQSSDNRVSLNAAIGPSFANLGTTFSTTAGVDYNLNDRATLVSEFGVLPHAPFDKASTIAAPLAIPGSDSPRVNAYHWNGNLKVRPFEFGRFEPYVTGGFGSFTTSATIAAPAYVRFALLAQAGPMWCRSTPRQGARRSGWRTPWWRS